MTLRSTSVLRLTNCRLRLLCVTRITLQSLPAASGTDVARSEERRLAPQQMFLGLPTPPGGTGDLILWRSHRTLRHTMRVGPLFVVAVTFLCLSLHCLFMTEWSPDTSFFDMITGSVVKRESSSLASSSGRLLELGDSALADPLADRRTWLDERVEAKRRRYFGRFTGLQLTLGAIYGGISVFAFYVYWRAATTVVVELAACYVDHRISHWRVVLYGPIGSPLVRQVPFRDLHGRSSAFNRPYAEAMSLRAHSGKAIRFGLRDVRASLVIIPPDTHTKLVPGEVWQPEKIHALLYSKGVGKLSPS